MNLLIKHRFEAMVLLCVLLTISVYHLGQSIGYKRAIMDGAHLDVVGPICVYDEDGRVYHLKSEKILKGCPSFLEWREMNEH